MALLLQNDTLKRTQFTSNFKGEENFKVECAIYFGILNTIHEEV
jgi:hypothetical protein